MASPLKSSTVARLVVEMLWFTNANANGILIPDKTILNIMIENVSLTSVLKEKNILELLYWRNLFGFNIGNGEFTLDGTFRFLFQRMR